MSTNFTASTVPSVHHSGCPLALRNAAVDQRLLDRTHEAWIDGTFQWGAEVVELVAIATIVTLSVGLGMAGACAILSMVFLCLTPSSTQSAVAATARPAIAYESGANARQPFRMRVPAAS
jgi:hypothetical protein